jgi:hypothetical protein
VAFEDRGVVEVALRVRVDDVGGGRDDPTVDGEGAGGHLQGADSVERVSDDGLDGADGHLVRVGAEGVLYAAVSCRSFWAVPEPWALM